MTETILIDTTTIVPGANDRTRFDHGALQELADSIREHGLLQPISVRPLDGTELYQIIAGERRYRACRDILDLPEVECIIRDATDEEAAALMLAENVARADLDPIDEAHAYQSRIDAFGWTVEDCSLRAGVSPVRVQFRLKLLRLTDDVQHLIRSGNVSIGYAQIAADAELDSNFQRIAMRHLRDNSKPTPGWFRHLCADLRTQQDQATLFDDAGLLAAPAPIEIKAQPIDPPHPSTTTPPQIGRTMSEKLRHQVTFWTDAAGAWAQIGKPFKRQECEAAAQALTSVLDNLSQVV